MPVPLRPTLRIDKPRAVAAASTASRMIVVDIDDGRGAAIEQRLEQPQLGGEIGLESLMIVEMIAGDVGEAARRDAQAVEPELIEAVRRCFDGKMGDAVAGERIDRTVQLDRIRRRQRAVSLAAR